MRIRCFALAVSLFVGLAWSNSEDKTYYFTHPVSNAELTTMCFAVRNLLQNTTVTPDEGHQAIVVHGPVDKLVAVDWLFHQLDRSPSASPATTPAEYKMGAETLTVIPISAQADSAVLTAAVTSIRTIVDMQRIVPYEGQHAILSVGSPEKTAATEWLARQITPADSQPQTVDSPRYPMEPERSVPGAPATVTQILRLDPKTTNPQLTSIVTAIRAVADIQRLFPFSAGPAIILRASPEQVDTASWVVNELAKPAVPGSVRETTIPGLSDGIVRLFYVGANQDPAALATKIRKGADIQRVYPFAAPAAVLLRARPDQMSTVEAIVAKFGESQ